MTAPPPEAVFNRRRLLLPVVLIVAVSLSLHALLSRPDPSTWHARQVVLITIGGLRADRLGAYGYRAQATSPNLDQLAQQAVVFEHADAAAPEAIPSLAAVLAGRDGGGLPPDRETLAELFHAHGVATAAFAAHAELVGERGGFRRGFDTVVPERVVPLRAGEPKGAFAPVEPALMGWLDAHATAPFFLWIQEMSPDPPPTDGNPWLATAGWDPYDAEVRNSDDLVGRVLRKLAQLRLGDDLLLVVTADRGAAPDEALHVPLLIAAPVFEPRRVAAPVELVDLYPTIATLAGLPVQPAVRGESLVPLLTGAASAAAAAPATPEVLVDAAAAVPGLRLDMRYATPNNFTGRTLYPAARCLLRPAVAARLARAQDAAARAGLGLKVFDCYRPLAIQRELWALVPDERYVADPAKGSRHNRGAAVDLTLVDASGAELPMPTGFDDFTERAHRDYAALPADAIANRARLEHLMADAGFTGLPTEWWHFDADGWEQFEVLDLPLR